MENFTFGADIEGMTKETAAQTPDRSSLSEQRILEAARKLFMEHGFSAVSGDQLCKEARVSKTTLYKYFGDMTGVLGAVVVEEGDIFDLKVDVSPASEQEFWDVLTGYGTRLLNLLNRRFCLRLDRMLHEQARENHELATVFYDNAYGRGHRDVTAMIQFGQDHGYIERPEAATDLADHLLSMWEGLRLVRARLSLTDKPFENPADWAESCVTTLLKPWKEHSHE